MASTGNMTINALCCISALAIGERERDLIPRDLAARSTPQQTSSCISWWVGTSKSCTPPTVDKVSTRFDIWALTSSLEGARFLN